MRRILTLFLIGLMWSCSPNSGKPGALSPVPAAKRPKVCIIGFDGATWESLDHALSRNMMPNLARLMREGVSGPLKTIRPTLTPVVWTSIATAKMPDKHGITGLLVKDEWTGQMVPINSMQRKVKAYWQMLSDSHRDVCIVRWPVSWPAEPVNGYLITDFAFQRERKRITWPRNFMSGYSDPTPDYRLKDIEYLTGIDQAQYERLAPAWQWKLMLVLREYHLDFFFHNVAKKLLAQGQKDMTAVYFYSMDALGHSFFKFNDPEGKSPEDPDFTSIIPNWCGLYDHFLGELLALLDPDTTIIICSDHGMKLAIKPQNFLIRSENDPPKPGETEQVVSVPPGPEYTTDPLSIKILYTLPSGQHVYAPDGIFCIKGPGIRKNVKIKSAGVCDITPTMLYAMGLPVAQDFQGHVLDQVFTDAFKSGHKLRTIPTYETGANPHGARKQLRKNDANDEENDLLMNRLRALGYIK